MKQTWLSVGMVMAIATAGCSVTQNNEPKVQVNSWMNQFSEFSFDNLLNDYLATNAITDERARWYINTYPDLSDEFAARIESGVGAEAFVEKQIEQLEQRQKVGKFSSFHRIRLHSYDQTGKFFNLLDRDGIGMVETLWNSYSAASSYDAPGWFKIKVRTDRRGWVWKVEPERAMTIIANNKSRQVMAYTTYELDKCQSTQDSGEALKLGVTLGQEYAHQISCDLIVTGIKFYDTPKITSDTMPYGQASYIGTNQ